jgi:hypothetical protein
MDEFSSQAWSDLQFVPVKCDGKASRALFLKQLRLLGLRDWSCTSFASYGDATLAALSAQPPHPVHDLAASSGDAAAPSAPSNIDVDMPLASAAGDPDLLLERMQKLRQNGLHIRASLSSSTHECSLIPFRQYSNS